jgi:hypothetical protein
MSDNYLLPGEFLGLVAFWFIPPSVIAVLVLRKYFNRMRPVPSLPFQVTSLVAAPIVGTALGIVWLAAFPFKVWFLAVVDIHVGDRYLPFLPLAYLSVGLVAVAFALAARIGRRKSMAI